jgi:hypothetical protein
MLTRRAAPAFMALCALFTVHGSTAQALEIVAAVRNTTGYDSNTLLTENDEIGTWVNEPGIDLQAYHGSAALLLDVRYSYTRRIYQKVWQDENVLTGVSSARWFALPERLDFFVSNVRTESTILAQLGETRANRQVVSETKAGSTLRLRPRRADELQFEYAFVDIDGNRTLTGGSRRHNATARYLAGLSADRTLAFETTYSNIDYDGFFPQAQFLIITGGYSQTSDALDLDIHAGYNWFKREGRGSTGDWTCDATLTWRATSTSTLELSAFRGIVDQSTSLSGAGSSVPENSGLNAAFLETRVELGLSQTLGRTTLAISGFWHQEDYAPDVPFDNSRAGGLIGLSRRLTRRTSLDLTADYSRRKFQGGGNRLGEDRQDEVRASFFMSHRISRSLDFSWGVTYESRSAQTTRSYDRWNPSVQLRYTFWGAAR